MLRTVAFPELLEDNSPISAAEFDGWHQSATENLCRRKPALCVGWAAKMVKIYLKTAVYVGDRGRPGLREAIHPPIDSGLWRGLKDRFIDHPLLKKIQVVHQIKVIRYNTYQSVIEGCRLATKQIGCLLIEVDQLWNGADASQQAVAGDG